MWGVGGDVGGAAAEPLSGNESGPRATSVAAARRESGRPYWTRLIDWTLLTGKGAGPVNWKDCE